MSLLQAKQINKQLAAYVRVSGFSASGTSDPVTTDITTVLSTAGEGAVSVPLQVADTTNIGVITTGNNRVEIYDATTKLKLQDGGNEIYGRLTESSNVYTLSYFTLVAGVETAYSFATTVIDFEFAYKFDFNRLPFASIINVKTRNVSDDPSNSGTGGLGIVEVLTVTAPNTLANLTKTPNGGVILFVNGQGITSADSPAAFTRSGKELTWSATNAGYALATTDLVVANYSSYE